MRLPIIERVVTVTLNPTIDRILEVPGFRVGAHLRGRCRSRLPAGKAMNVSRALAALGVPTTAMGWVGTNDLEAFEQAARAAGAAARFTPIADAARENITILDPTGPSETHIRDVGPTVSNEDIERLSAELSAEAGETVPVVFTGSCAPGVDPERFGQLLDLCLNRSAPVVIDASGAPLTVAARRPLWILKPNLAELAELMGEDVSSDAAILRAGRELGRRIGIVLVTLGSRGAFCFAGDAVLFGRLPIPPERVRSTVGCGDAMLGGFLAGLREPGRTIASALRRGLAAAAASAMHEQPAMFAAEEAGRLAGRAEVVPVR